MARRVVVIGGGFGGLFTVRGLRGCDADVTVVDRASHHLVPRSVYMKNDVPVAGCAHQAGTVRFGHDPGTSVLDVDCKTHELDNLYVVDTSFFPSIGAVNPALTAMANALRVGDRLLERLG